MTEMSWSRAEVEILLQEYQKHTNLYHVRSTQYKNRNLRKKSLDSITEVLKIYKPAITSQEVQAKFQALKQTAQRERTKIKNSAKSGAGSESIYESSLWYLDQMQFVFDTSEPRHSVDSLTLDEESQNEQGTLPEDQDSDGNENESIHLKQNESQNSQVLNQETSSAGTSGASWAGVRGTNSKSSKEDENKIMSSVSRNLDIISQRLSASNTAAVGKAPGDKRKQDEEDHFAQLVQSKLRKIANDEIKEEVELAILTMLHDALKRDRTHSSE